MGIINFQQAYCNGRCFFDDTRFYSKNNYVDFLAAEFGRDITFDRVIFNGGIRLEGLRCGGVGLFRDTQFENENQTVSFKFATFVGGLEFVNVKFPKYVDFSYVNSNRLSLSNISFSHKGSQVDGVDLSDSIFSDFIGDKNDTLKLLNAQSSQTFSREPYLQLEKYYQKIGDEVEATKIYLLGRDAVRKHAKMKGSNIKWPFFKLFGDWLLNILVRYGTQTGRLFLLIILLFLEGIRLYYPKNALLSADSENIFVTSLGEKFLYVIDLFLPVNINFAEKWIPSWFGGQIYSAILIISGWLIVPLLIASLSGYVRKQ